MMWCLPVSIVHLFNKGLYHLFFLKKKKRSITPHKSSLPISPLLFTKTYSCIGAIAHYGEALKDGRGARKDLRKGIFLLKVAADAGHSGGQITLVDAAQYGDEEFGDDGFCFGCHPDIVFKYSRMAAQNENGENLDGHASLGSFFFLLILLFSFYFLPFF